MTQRILPVAAALALALSLCSPADAGNHNGKFALSFAGGHYVKMDRCNFNVNDCEADLVTDVVELNGWAGIQDAFDIHIVAIDVDEITAARFGLYGEVATGPAFEFTDWRSCAMLEIPTDGWPGLGEGNAVSWGAPQAGPNVVIGFVTLYILPYTNAKLCADVDPRVGFAEFCDGSEPVPHCDRTSYSSAFGCVGFNRLGYNPCTCLPAQSRSWGALKSLYR
jgi:hypothetical protein